MEFVIYLSLRRRGRQTCLCSPLEWIHSRSFFISSHCVLMASNWTGTACSNCSPSDTDAVIMSVNTGQPSILLRVSFWQYWGQVLCSEDLFSIQHTKSLFQSLDQSFCLHLGCFFIK